MSLSTLVITIPRIRAASTDSPLIILEGGHNDDGQRQFEVLFADTINGYAYLKNPCPRYIGTYNGGGDVDRFLADASA